MTSRDSKGRFTKRPVRPKQPRDARGHFVKVEPEPPPQGRSVGPWPIPYTPYGGYLGTASSIPVEASVAPKRRSLLDRLLRR